MGRIAGASFHCDICKLPGFYAATCPLLGRHEWSRQRERGIKQARRRVDAHRIAWLRRRIDILVSGMAAVAAVRARK